VIYTASVTAANIVLRATLAAAFPLFTPKMYENLGVHWASAVPAFIALACFPFPIFFLKYGERIRRKCRYSAEAARYLDALKSDREKKVTSGDEAGLVAVETRAEQVLVSPGNQELNTREICDKA
jgi:hypothetical protein